MGCVFHESILMDCVFLHCLKGIYIHEVFDEAFTGIFIWNGTRETKEKAKKAFYYWSLKDIEKNVPLHIKEGDKFEG